MNLGDDVLYYHDGESSPLPGKVASLVNDVTVNLACLHEDGTWHSYAAVNVVVAGQPLPTQRYCEKRD